MTQKLIFKSLILQIAILNAFFLTAIKAQEPPEAAFLSFGMHEVNRANRALSRGEALKECLTDAVKQYTAQNVAPNLLHANHDILKRTVYGNYNLFLQNYRIRDEKEEDGFYKITAEVTLKGSLLSEKLDSLGMLTKPDDKPRLLVLVSDSENVKGRVVEASWWTNDPKEETTKFSAHKAIEGRLSSMGFPLVEKSKFLSSLGEAKVSLQNRVIRGDIDTIRRFKFKDILISGITSLSVEPGDSAETLFISASCHNLRDGKALSKLDKSYNLTEIEKRVREEKEGSGLAEAVRYAADDFTAELVVSFLKGWYSSGINTSLVELKLKGIYSYKSYADIKKLLEGLKPDIVKVKDLMMEKGAYTFQIEITGDSRAVAGRISKMLIDGKTMTIESLSRRRIVAELR